MYPSFQASEIIVEYSQIYLKDIKNSKELYQGSIKFILNK